ncbi:hypothetical protein HGP05_01485 [Streptococcus sanguinis]|uniref:Uncharacterized protein n=1 Tax=Streptococcus sanguinis TaxID=1305 RepID=A0A7Y0YRU7_STRSA|nr:hypothetical protein [Streptococcus sanguinis]
MLSLLEEPPPQAAKPKAARPTKPIEKIFSNSSFYSPLMNKILNLLFYDYFSFYHVQGDLAYINNLSP